MIGFDAGTQRIEQREIVLSEVRKQSVAVAPGQLTTPDAELVEHCFQMANSVRQRYGMSRLELGLLLDTIKENRLWEGKAGSFLEYVDDLRLNRTACRNYMRVARKFIVELQVSKGILDQLAACNMSVLVRAANVITMDNAADVIASILGTHQRDALAVLEEFGPARNQRPRGDPVANIFDSFMKLTDDRRIEFLSKLRRGKNSYVNA